LDLVTEIAKHGTRTSFQLKYNVLLVDTLQ
jgi:hypothetical protein